MRGRKSDYSEKDLTECVIEEICPILMRTEKERQFKGADREIKKELEKQDSLTGKVLERDTLQLKSEQASK